MPRNRYAHILLWSFLPWLTLSSVARGSEAELRNAIASVLASADSISTAYGITIVNLTDASVVYDRHGDAPLIPASNQKLLVMAAALDVLGPAFAFRTILAAADGDVIVIGDGDPAFEDEKLLAARNDSRGALLERWATALTQGIDGAAHGSITMTGDIVVDDSIFDDQWTHPSWERNDLHKWYAAPVGGLNVNGNCLDISYKPARRQGDPIRWEVTPPCTTANIANKATTASKGRPLITPSAEPMSYVLSGRCAKAGRFPSVPVADPGAFFADVIRSTWGKYGIEFTGDIRRTRVRNEDGSIPGTLRVLAEHRTPLADVLQRIGADSQNLFAECLMKRLGYEYMRGASSAPAQGSWVTGATALKAFLTGRGIDSAGLVISDASGLSRDNRITTRQLAALLAIMRTDSNYELFASCLAVAGEEGSLRRRMRDITGTVYGKTGTMRGIRALTAYVDAAGGDQFVVSMIFNDIKGPASRAKQIQDDVCRLLVSYAE